MFLLQINKFICYIFHVIFYFLDVSSNIKLEVSRYIALNVWNTVQKIKAMLKVSKVHCTDFNALNAIYVEDGVCSFYATLYTEYRSDVKGVKGTLDTVASHPSRREGLYSLLSCGFSGSPPVSLRRQLC